MVAGDAVERVAAPQHVALFRYRATPRLISRTWTSTGRYSFKDKVDLGAQRHAVRR